MAKRRGRKAPGQRSLAELRDDGPVVTENDKRRGPPMGRYTPDATISTSDRSRHFADLRFSTVANYIRQARRGRTEDWADFTRKILEDPDVISAVDTRLDAVASAPWKVEPAKTVPEALKEDAARAATAVTDMMDAVPGLELVLRDLLDAIGMGYAVAEIIWGRRAGWWVPVEIVAVHPRRICFADDFEVVLRLESLERDLEGERIHTRDGLAVRLPPDKYIIHQPRQILDYPTGAGLFIPTAKWWWVKQQVIKYWLGGAEQQGNRRWHATYTQSTHPTAKDEVRQVVQDLAAEGIVASSDAITVKDIGGNFSDATATWQGLADLCDKAFPKLWLGSTLNTDVGDSGSRALGESQRETTIDPRRDRDARSLWGSWRKCVVEPFLRFNSYPIGKQFDRMPPMPTVTSVFAEDVVEVDELAVQSGAVRVDELRVSRGLPPLGGTEGARFVTPLARQAMPRGASSDASAAEVGDDPLPQRPRPMSARDFARRMLSTGAAETSGPSPTRSANVPSNGSGAPPS